MLIVILVVILIILLIIKNNKKEHAGSVSSGSTLYQDPESIRNISNLYNSQNMIVSTLTVNNELRLGNNVIKLDTDGNLQIDNNFSINKNTGMPQIFGRDMRYQMIGCILRDGGDVKIFPRLVLTPGLYTIEGLDLRGSLVIPASASPDGKAIRELSINEINNLNNTTVVNSVFNNISNSIDYITVFPGFYIIAYSNMKFWTEPKLFIVNLSNNPVTYDCSTKKLLEEVIVGGKSNGSTYNLSVAPSSIITDVKTTDRSKKILLQGTLNNNSLRSIEVGLAGVNNIYS